MKRLLLMMAVVAFAWQATAQKIDFNKGGRPETEGNETGYTPWVVSEASSATLEVDGITITIAPTPGYEGETVMSNYWKQGVTSYGAKLIGDGVCVYYDDHANINGGAVGFDVTISGLPAGTHALQAFHNNFDGLDAPPIDVYVNGEKKLSGIVQTNRERTPSASGQSYVEFQAVEGQPVVVSYITVPAAGATYGTTTVTVNALVFNESDNKKIAVDPVPANEDYHADADNGSLILQWTAAEGAVRHHVYFGTDAENLVETTATTETSYTVSGLTNHNTYFWRVDEEDASGTITAGQTWTFRPRHLAFPGAEGYGRFATGGRGGSVYHVTSLDDDANDPQPGTFRYGITKVSGPRTIVFDVSGVIELKSRLSCSDKNITIAGQTSPGTGILFRGCALGFTDESIVRFIRLHLGGGDDWDGSSPNPHTSDGIGMAGANHSIMDHCSIAWTIDEGFSSRNAKNLTLQKTIISEALNYVGHSHYAEEGRLVEHGYAATIGAGQAEGTVGSFHHNLLAHNQGRNWSISGGLDGGGSYDGHHDVFNNVVYNWGGRTTDGGTHEMNFVNNFYKMGAASSITTLCTLELEGTGKGTQSVYVSGNVRQAKNNGALTEDKLNDTYKYRLTNGQVLDWEPFVTEPFFPSYANIETARAAYKNVLSDVGCNQPFMSNHDQRMVDETIKGITTTVGTYTKKKGLIDKESDSEGFEGLNITSEQRPADWDSDQDGMPDWWEKARGLNPLAADNNEDPDGDGYTNLEDYLNWMAMPHFIVEQGTSVELDMKDYFAGYANQPEFNVIAADGLLCDASASPVIRFSPNADAAGFLTATVRASDKDGWGTFDRTFNFYVSGTTGVSSLSSDGNEAATDYEVYTLGGQLVKRMTVKGGQSANLEGLARGAYVVKARSGEQTIRTYKEIVR